MRPARSWVNPAIASALIGSTLGATASDRVADTSPGTVVKAGTRGMDIGITTVGPLDEARHRVQ
jgi:hypothetical protein